LGVQNRDIEILRRTLFDRPNPKALAPPTKTRLDTILELIEKAKKVKEEEE